MLLLKNYLFFITLHIVLITYECNKTSEINNCTKYLFLILDCNLHLNNKAGILKYYLKMQSSIKQYFLKTVTQNIEKNVKKN